MSGSIFILDKSNIITELKETQYSSEDIFQELIVGQTSDSISIKGKKENTKWEQDSFINEVENINK